MYQLCGRSHIKDLNSVNLMTLEINVLCEANFHLIMLTCRKINFQKDFKKSKNYFEENSVFKSRRMSTRAVEFCHVNKQLLPHMPCDFTDKY